MTSYKMKMKDKLGDSTSAHNRNGQNSKMDNTVSGSKQALSKKIDFDTGLG